MFARACNPTPPTGGHGGPQIEQRPPLRFVYSPAYSHVVYFARFSEVIFRLNSISLNSLPPIFLYEFSVNLEKSIARKRNFDGKRAKIQYIKACPQIAQGRMVF